MKRILFFAVMMMAVTLFMGCASFVNWGKRINLTVGGGGALNAGGISVENIECMSGTIRIKDGYGDIYTTSWVFNEKEPANTPVAASLSIPVYWKDFNEGIDIEAGIISKTSLLYGGGGVYFEGTVGSIGINLAAGGSLPVATYYETSSKPAGYAWQSDPGMYIGGKFRDPSSFQADVSVKSELIPGLFASVSLKWHFIDWLYFEGGYSYYGKTEEKITGLSVKTDYTFEEKYGMNGSISLTDRQIVYMGIGIGF